MAQHRYHRKDIITPYFYDIIAILNTNYSNRNHRQGRQSLSTLAGDSFNLYRFPRFPFSSSGLPLPLPSSFSRKRQTLPKQKRYEPLTLAGKN